MGESTLYLAADLDEIEAMLRGSDPEIDAASVVLAHDVEDEVAGAAIARMRAGEPLVWDASPMRAASWSTYAALSAYFAAVYRLFGRAVHFDAWPDGLRMQFVLADWYPLDRSFGEWLSCRPPSTVRFDRFDTSDAEERGAYLETFPHGWIRREEIEDVLPSVHTLINALATSLGAEDGGPLSEVSPGTTLAPERWLELTTLDDGSLEGWQLQRVLSAYHAMCLTADVGRDLIVVGF